MSKNYNNFITVDKLKIVKKENRKMVCTTIIPSASHSYALAVEYIQNWFLSKFPKDFFKTIYIEGKNIFDESRRFSINNTARRQNPSVAIIPTIDFSFDRDKIDLPLGGLELYEEKSTTDTCFFRDYENKLYIKEIEQLNLLNFTIRVYVDTRAKQLNLWHYMKLAFRVGATQGEYVDMDFSLPDNLMLQLAHDNNFDIDLENNKIKDPINFLNYLNKKSLLPILYKLRCENGRDEFFIRSLGEYVHIAIPDPLSVDDGDRVGHTYESFPIEMNLNLRFPTPQSYIYLSKNPQTIIESTRIDNSDDIAGLYSIKFMDIPLMNKLKWGLYIQTEYTEENESSVISINFEELLDNTLKEVIKYTMDQYISPKIFIDIDLYDTEQKLIPYNIDWKKFIITTEIDETDRKYRKIIIAIYVDNTYLNESIVTINNSSNIRINKTNTQ